MRRFVSFALAVWPLLAQIPSLAEVRKEMGIPSVGDLRGQKDTVGFASTAAGMAATWKASEAGPTPESFGPPLSPGVLGALCPHDDYVFAGRVYRKVIPLVTAKTVVLVGVFHKWRRFGAKDALVLDESRAWRAPDGEIPVSPLREDLVGALKPGDVIRSAAMHDSEHSLEAIAYWLKHQRKDVEILPILLPVASFERFQDLADRAGKALAGTMAKRGLKLGRDVAIVISSDGVHYGDDFQHSPFGSGGVAAYQQAAARDRALLTGSLAGAVTSTQARAFFEACVDPKEPGTYRMPWCGRYSVPFGLLLLEATAKAAGMKAPVGHPVALSFTVDVPELPLKAHGLGATAPANLYHFVGIPAAAYTE